MNEPKPFAARAERASGRSLPRVLLKLLAALLLLLATLWSALALHYGPSSLSRGILDAAAALLILAGLLAIVSLFVVRLRFALWAALAGIVATQLWLQSAAPSNDRNWQPDVAELPWAEVDGDIVRFHNVRNFEYRSETDYTPVWSEREYDLRELDSGDILASYWMGDDIAHIFLSFGFGGRDYLSVSIETRKEVGESYSTLAGFFRNYELYYVVAGERDLVRLRTNVRADPPEDVYLYRTNAPRENLRRLFLDYVREINSLREKAEFYNTLTTNCTTSIWLHARVNNNSPTLSWKILASGHVPQYLWETGRLDGSLPFEELRRRSHINAAARAADTAPDFSQRIREGLPQPKTGSGTVH